MSLLNFNAEEVNPSVGFDAIPAGKYQAVITESEMKPTKSGTGRYLELSVEIIDGEFKGRKLWSRLNLENPNEQAVAIANADLSAICHAVNVLRPRDSVELHDRPLIISVRCRKNPDSDELVNDIKGYEARGGNFIPAQAPAKPAAAPWSR